MVNEKVAENLRSAFGGESQAHMRYQIWGETAEKEGFPRVKTLFDAISFAESVHAKSHFQVIKDVKGDFEVTSMAGFGIGNTSENLQAAANGERWEIDVMYSDFLKTAEEAGEKRAIQSINYAKAAEGTHEKMYLAAKEYVDEGKDIDFENIHVCPICGYVSYGEMEENCPICNAPSSKFIKY